MNSRRLQPVIDPDVPQLQTSQENEMQVEHSIDHHLLSQLKDRL